MKRKANVSPSDYSITELQFRTKSLRTNLKSHTRRQPKQSSAFTTNENHTMSYASLFNWIMGRHEWSPTSRGKALGLCAAGNHPLCEIMEIINIPKSTIGDIKTHGTGISKPRSGCPKKLSTCDIWQIIRYIHVNESTRRISLTQL